MQASQTSAKSLILALAILSGVASAASADEAPPAPAWTTAIHGWAFLTYNNQGGASGGSEFASQNHFMLMASRPLAGGTLDLLGTFTLEPATIPAHGTHELFQRGETYHGVLLIDYQHPHDFFAQLAAQWRRPIGGGLGLRFYLAPVGEPALGPQAYPHRPSASEDPLAPLAHHNQDSTHISYDVVTAALESAAVDLEGSAFHGAEPDENRWNIEAGRIDSYSGRLTVRPVAGLSLQVSAGHLEHPESIEPGNQTRTSASVSWEQDSMTGAFAATLALGRNQTDVGPEWGNLLEFDWKFADVNFVFGRVESVQRDLGELLTKQALAPGAPHVPTTVDAATIGFTRDLPLLTEAETGLGAAATFYHFDSRLDAAYGAHPVSFQVFLRVRFGDSAGHMHHMMM